MIRKTQKNRRSGAVMSSQFKPRKKILLEAKRPIPESTACHMTREELLEKICFDVMSIIMSCESADNANSYDVGHRDGVSEVKVVVDSYFRNLPDELSEIW